jgi:hypothetical protein
MRVIWNALGLYISRNLKMGRGVNVPKLGIFTFTPPEVRLKVLLSPPRELQMRSSAISSLEHLSFSSRKSSLKVSILELPSFITNNLVVDYVHMQL